MLGQIDGVRFEGSDSFQPVQCSGTKAIISGMTTRHMIDHHVGTCGVRDSVRSCWMYAIHYRLYLGQVHLVNVKHLYLPYINYNLP